MTHRRCLDTVASLAERDGVGHAEARASAGHACPTALFDRAVTIACSTRRRRSRSPSSSRPASRRPTPPSRGQGGVPAWRRRPPTARGCCAGWRRSSRSTARSSRGSSPRTSASRSRAPAARSGWSPRCFHFYAGAVDKHYGETIPVAGGMDVDVPRAARRRRADRAVELPAQHRHLEARPRARLRQHGRAEAGGADAALGASARRARARGRHPRRRRQRPRRARLGRRAAGSSSIRTSPRSASPARPRSAATS